MVPGATRSEQLGQAPSLAGPRKGKTEEVCELSDMSKKVKKRKQLLKAAGPQAAAPKGEASPHTVSIDPGPCNISQSPQPPRWDAETSPLTISFWFGSPAAPDSVKEQVVLEPRCGEHDGYILLPWRDALAVLHRANVEWFEFYPDDLNWQVNGWKLLENGLLPVTPLSEDELRQWSHLPENPTTADFAAEVMHQYLADIDLMSYNSCITRLQDAGMLKSESEDTAHHIHQAIYEPLTAGLDAWTDTALVGLPHPDHVVLRVDVRQLVKRAYEIAYAGHSDINPLNEAGEIDSMLFRSAAACSSAD